MASTYFNTGDALTAKIWSAKLIKEAQKEMFFTRFIGENSNSIVQEVNDLTKQKGDRITIPLLMRLSGTGQSGLTGITLEGNEEALTFYDFSVTIYEHGYAVRARSTIDLQRPAFKVRDEMKDALKMWLSDKMENLFLEAAITSPSAGRTINKTGENPGTLSVAYIQAMKRAAQLATPKIRPIKVDGESYYVLLAHPYATKGLKADTDWKNAQLYANIRGKTNPLFSGVLGAIDGVLVYEYDRPNLLYDTSAKYAYTLLFGAQALVCAWASKPTWKEKMFDYDAVPGVATRFLLGVGKTVFNSNDFATITLKHKYTTD